MVEHGGGRRALAWNGLVFRQSESGRECLGSQKIFLQLLACLLCPLDARAAQGPRFGGNVLVVSRLDPYHHAQARVQLEVGIFSSVLTHLDDEQQLSGLEGIQHVQSSFFPIILSSCLCGCDPPQQLCKKIFSRATRCSECIVPLQAPKHVATSSSRVCTAVSTRINKLRVAIQL